jgi:PTS system nitrogen regulatory IIA component
MDLSDLLTPDSVIARLKVATKKQALQELASLAARRVRMDERVIFDTLLERERLGTTGVGRGVAIPHGKLAGLKQLHGFFARLEQPIDFDAIDGLPVDLIFVLLAPESAGADHLKALARISRLMRNAPMCERLRATDNADALYALLTGSTASHAA